MKIFITGASGWIGSAVVPELMTAGHTVVRLAPTVHGDGDKGFIAMLVTIAREKGTSSREDANEHFGFLGNFLSMDSPVSSELTCTPLNWQPTHLGLIEDLEKGHYFAA